MPTIVFGRSYQHYGERLAGFLFLFCMAHCISIILQCTVLYICVSESPQDRQG